MPQTSFDSTQLPTLQRRNQCVLVPRDPHFIYAYWDYVPEDIDRGRKELRAKSEDAQLVLRVYDITHIEFNGSNANHTWDLDVGFSTKNWYIQVWQDNADYCAELGVSCGANHFIPLNRSNIAHTPPKSASKRNDLIWQDIKTHKESQPYIEEAIKDRYKRYHTFIQYQSKKKLNKEKQPPGPRVYYLTAQDIRAYYMGLFSRMSKKGGRTAQARPQAPSIESLLKGKLRGISWQKVRPILTYPDLIKRVHQGASMEFLENKGASESLSGPQAGGSEGRLNKRKFFFEIGTELIVYGRTEPDAMVLFNEKEIKLNPDGTFSLRYALPDGEVPLEFIAQSSDGIEQRHIYTRVERARTISFPKMLKDPND